MQEVFYNSIKWENSDLSNWHVENTKYNFLYNYKFDTNSTVVDIGSYNGTWLKTITSMYGCYGLGLEPVNKFYLESLNHINDKLQFINAGITIKNEHKVKINLNVDSTNIMSTGGDCEVTLINVIDFLNNLCFKQIDLLQINIEGYEYELLPYMIENNLFNNINNLQIQFHSISNLSENKYMDIKKKLNEIGFKDTFDFKLVWYGATKI